MRGPKNSHNDLSAEFVREIFDYDKTTGLLCWKKSLSRRAPVGRPAGAVDDQGRIKIGIKGKDYFAHRIIWVWMTGAWPEYEVDHRNRVKSDNRWCNLRKATPSQNHRNRGKPSNNKSGHKGVCFDNNKQKWLATINVKKAGKKKHVHLGWFTSIDSAAAAYKAAAKIFHGEEWMCF